MNALLTVALILAFDAQEPIRVPPPIPPRSVPQIKARKPSQQISLPQIPDTEETINYSKVGNWLVNIDLTLDGGCFVYAAFSDQSSIRVGLIPNQDSFYILLGNSYWRSLKTSQMYAIGLTIDRGLPWYVQSSIVNIGHRNHLVINRQDDEFLRAFLEGNDMKVEWKGKEIAFLDLTGIADAVGKIFECQEKVEKVLDPFAE